MREKSELIKRYLFFFVGIISQALGVAFITRSMLGTGPTTCIPYVISLKYPLSFGSFNFMFNMLLLVLQIVLLRRNFKKIQFLQIPVSFLFSACIDIAMALTTFVNADYYVLALVYTLLGCVLRAFGVSCQVLADVVMLSTEAFVKAVSDAIKKEFSVCKLSLDALMVAIAAFLSFVFFGRIEAIREGTLITVILVGPISHFFTRRLGFTNFYFENEGNLVFEPKFKINDNKRLVITIASEGGSGGRVIARILGALLDIPVYDKELVYLIAREGHLDTAFVERHNEHLYNNMAQAFIFENYTLAENSVESYKELYDAQCMAIRNLAETQDCIIVGHCSNFILKGFPGAMHILITADMAHRVEYISEKYKIGKRKAIEHIETEDSDLDDFCLHFTGQNWKDSSNYHMSMDSTLFGYEGTAEMIEQIIKKNYIDQPKTKVRDLVKKYHLEKQDE